KEWKLVVRSVDDALGDHGLSVSDVTHVLTTHLHQDHYGQNVVFRKVPFFLQRIELERAKLAHPELINYFDFAGARFELLDGDLELVEGVHAVATPGHTSGHQSILIETQ